MKESFLIKECIAAGSHNGATLFRNNQGKFQDSRGIWVRFGVGVGGSDLIGYSKDGRFLAFEIKKPGWKPSGEKQHAHYHRQLKFIEDVRKAGGIAGIVHGYEDVAALLKGQNAKP
jgi:hypothetical protein